MKQQQYYDLRFELICISFLSLIIDFLKKMNTDIVMIPIIHNTNQMTKIIKDIAKKEIKGEKRPSTVINQSH
jgi:hypothetical protein